MTNNLWTPGPWEMIVDDTGGPFTGWPSVIAPEEIDGSIVHRAGFKQEFWGDWSQREAIANARLIAAAPEMAEALADMVEIVEHIERSYGGRINPPTVDNARALLARIRGE